MINRYSTAIRILENWLPLAVAITILAGLAYGMMQQDLRITANDPQIQMAEDTAALLASGKDPQSLVPADKVDMARSLAPYLIVFDATGRSLAASVQLDGQTPLPPDGVFAYAKERGQNRFTWQPRPGVRSAAVLVSYGGARPGFMLAGRSLREVEKREDQILALAVSGWTVALAASLAVSVILVMVGRLSLGR